MSATLLESSRDDLQLLVTDVWSTHVDAQGLVPSAPHVWVTPTGDVAVPCWSGAVSVTGEWQGMIAIDLSEASARALGRGMLGLEEDEHLDPTELCDAVGEFANIVGGNVKSLMPGPSTLTLPLVAHTVLEAPSELHPQLTLDLLWGEAPVRVRVLALPTSNPPTGHPEDTP